MLRLAEMRINPATAAAPRRALAPEGEAGAPGFVTCTAIGIEPYP
jgi:hypothetical protein